VRPRWVLPIMIFAGVGMILSLAGLLTFLLRATHGPRPAPVATSLEPDPAALGLAIPPFTLTDQDGREQTDKLFEGRITVLDFIFTNCPFACPTMTMAMRDAAEQLRGTPVRFVSISVDPQRDTPERLRAFAAEHELDLSRWTLLTGDEHTIKQIVSGALQFLLQPDPDRRIPLRGGGDMPNIIHPTKLLLIGPDRRVLGMHESQSLGDQDVKRLVLRARAAAARLKDRR
jgi:protein SCO1/2